MQETVTITNNHHTKPVLIGTGLLTLDVIVNERKNRLYSKRTGGSTGNVLSILSAFGWDSYPIAYLGIDEPSSIILQDLKRNGVKTNFIIQNEKIYTPIIIEKLISNGKLDHKFKFKCSNCKSKLPQNRLIPNKYVDQINKNLPRSDFFYIDRLSVNGLKIVQEQKRRGAIIFFEPHRLSKESLFKQILKIADIIKYSEESIDNIPYLRSPLIEIQSLSENGVNYVFNNKNYLQPDFKHVDSFNVPASIDTTGSGDWFSSGLLYFLNNNGFLKKPSESKLLEAITFGQSLAALNCQYIGAREMMYYQTIEEILSQASDLILKGVFHSIVQEPEYTQLSEHTICNKCNN